MHETVGAGAFEPLSVTWEAGVHLHTQAGPTWDDPVPADAAGFTVSTSGDALYVAFPAGGAAYAVLVTCALGSLDTGRGVAVRITPDGGPARADARFIDDGFGAQWTTPSSGMFDSAKPHVELVTRAAGVLVYFYALGADDLAGTTLIHVERVAP